MGKDRKRQEMKEQKKKEKLDAAKQAEKQARREADRARIQAKQEQDRETATMFSWLFKTCRVLTIGATLLFMIMASQKAAALENAREIVLFTGLGAWTVFGLAWAAMGVLHMMELRKQGLTDFSYHRGYIINIAVVLAGILFFAGAFMAVR